MDRKIAKIAYFSVFKTPFASLFIILIFFISKPVYSQVGDSGQILRAGTEDAEILLREYLKPFGHGFGADINTGWFSSARPLGIFGFDLRASISVSLVPVNDRSFDISKLNLNSVKLLEGPSKTPTVFGDDTQTSILGSTEFNSSTQQEEEIYSFKMPKGSGYHFVPAPMAQFSLGLPGHTQVTLRYTPEIVIEKDYMLRLFGIGGMVGLNQLLFDNELPIDLSLQAGIMDLSANAKFDVHPPNDEHIENQFPDSHWDEQAINFDTKTFTTNLIVGKKFSILSLYGGVGYQYASTKITTEGRYPIIVSINDDSNSEEITHEIQSVAVPINITLDGANKIHAMAGLQLKLGFISISASYTVAEYSTLKAGVGIMVRPG